MDRKENGVGFKQVTEFKVYMDVSGRVTNWKKSDLQAVSRSCLLDNVKMPKRYSSKKNVRRLLPED
jgi:hypothetical protein